jgi:hypothetical protein
MIDEHSQRREKPREWFRRDALELGGRHAADKASVSAAFNQSCASFRRAPF